MLKIGQNVTVGYPDRNSVHKPGVIYNKTVGTDGAMLYWVRVRERNGVTHSGDTYLESDVRALEDNHQNESPEHFSIGNYVIVDGEQGEIKSVIGDGADTRYIVHIYGFPLREVTRVELS